MYIKDVNIVKYSGSQSVCSCMQDTMASSQLYNGVVKGSTRQLWNIYEFKVISFKVFKSCCSVGKLEGRWFLHVMSRNKSLIQNSEVVCVLVQFGGIGTPSIPPSKWPSPSQKVREYLAFILFHQCVLYYIPKGQEKHLLIYWTKQMCVSVCDTVSIWWIQRCLRPWPWIQEISYTRLVINSVLSVRINRLRLLCFEVI